MSVLVGLAFLVDWLLVDVFTVDQLKATLATGLIFLIIGILYEGYPRYRAKL